ncbi:hypothetical protein DRO33_01995 [Candidatus Bathyarchaeota archaeon]|nr:MAG: hypothetical protein DRO33_01995 [Candidatus Bathyarchaeota archaeon]
MRWTKSELDEVARRLSELASLIRVSEHELLTAMKVLSKASWANVEFSPLEGVEFEITSFFDDEIRLKITVRKGNTTIVREYRVPDFLVKGDVTEVCLRPVRARRPRRSRRRRARRDGS